MRELENDRLDKLAEDVDSLRDGAKMFRAVKALVTVKSPDTIIKVDDCIVVQPVAPKAVAKYFSSMLNKPEKDIITETQATGALQDPITPSEVQEAMKSLNNNRAAGSDAIPGELLKYGPPELSKQLAEILNSAIENNEDLELERGTLVVLNKPGKPNGPLTNLRPIVPLNTIRKVFSTIALNRIRPAAEKYLSANQSGFRINRSTADAVWAHKSLIAKISKVKTTIEILGIDMSRAFDTVNRTKLLEIIKSITSESNFRLAQKLITTTPLQARIKNELSSPFTTSMGVPQGDSFSPVAFTIYLEVALREVREACNRTANDKGLPTEICYADDADHLSKDEKQLSG